MKILERSSDGSISLISWPGAWPGAVRVTSLFPDGSGLRIIGWTVGGRGGRVCKKILPSQKTKKVFLEWEEALQEKKEICGYQGKYISFE